MFRILLQISQIELNRTKFWMLITIGIQIMETNQQRVMLKIHTPSHQNEKRTEQLMSGARLQGVSA